MPKFKGAFYKKGAFQELENSLKGTEKDTFEAIIRNIENAKDEYMWWFDITRISNGGKKIAVIGKLNKDGTPKKPGYFLDEAKNALNLFKYLSKWYEKNVEGYKRIGIK